MRATDHGGGPFGATATDDNDHGRDTDDRRRGGPTADLPEFRPGQLVPRDLRTAGELRAKGYPVPPDVAAWQIGDVDPNTGVPTRRPLFSTSAARRSRGDTWLRPARQAAAGTPPTAGPERGAPAGRPAVGHTPLRSGQWRRPSLHGDPRHWLSELFREGFVIIDTETTGLSARDEIIELAAVSSDGSVLFESKLWPRSGTVPPASTRIHGLTIEDLDGAPRWPDVLDALHQVVAGHRILAWNAPFDERLSVQSSRAWGVPHSLPGFECAMRAYAYGRGIGTGSFKLERAATVEGVLLADQSHRSADDARLTLAVLTSLHRKAGSRA